MDTKLKGDISEYSAAVRAMKLGWGVLTPIGDRLPYDLVFDVKGRLFKIQVKSAWLDKSSDNYVVNTRRIKTNRRIMLTHVYNTDDFDFALLHIVDLDVFYVMPVEIFVSYRSTVSLIERKTRQRLPKSHIYREAWHFIS